MGRSHRGPSDRVIVPERVLPERVLGSSRLAVRSASRGAFHGGTPHGSSRRLPCNSASRLVPRDGYRGAGPAAPCHSSAHTPTPRPPAPRRWSMHRRPFAVPSLAACLVSLLGSDPAILHAS